MEIPINSILRRITTLKAVALRDSPARFSDHLPSLVQRSGPAIVQVHLSTTRRALRATVLALATCTVPMTMAQKDIVPRPVGDHSVDTISTALKREETKNLIKSNGSHIYLNTIAIAPNDDPKDSLTLAWIVFPHDLVTLRACRVDKIGPANLLYEKYSPKGALALVNGGFYKSQSDNQAPIGLLISDGHEASPVVGWTSGGILLVRANSDIDIIPISQKDKIGNPKQALQSKPLLIENGTLAVKRDRTDEAFNRSAIGLTDRGDIVIAGAFREDNQAVKLYDFGRFLVLLKQFKGVNIRVALNLDGATDSHLYLAPSGLHLGYGGSNYVPSALAILPR